MDHLAEITKGDPGNNLLIRLNQHSLLGLGLLFERQRVQIPITNIDIDDDVPIIKKRNKTFLRFPLKGVEIIKINNHYKLTTNKHKITHLHINKNPLIDEKIITSFLINSQRGRFVVTITVTDY